MACAQASPTEARQQKIDAASANAVKVMMADLSRQPITANVNVRQFLDRTNGQDSMVNTLREADQIGGPRWIDENTCQVRLEIAGSKVAGTLVKLSDEAKEKSPIKPAIMKIATHLWDQRTFSAVGSSAAGDQVQTAVISTSQPTHVDLPAAPPKWSNDFLRATGTHGTATTKLRAARAAEQSAIGDLREQIDALAISDKLTVGSATKNDPTLNAAVERAVRRAKLTKLDYLADGGANVQVTVDLADVWREMVASRQDDATQP
jgi:hypothetical protein